MSRCLFSHLYPCRARGSVLHVIEKPVNQEAGAPSSAPGSRNANSEDGLPIDRGEQSRMLPQPLFSGSLQWVCGYGCWGCCLLQQEPLE